MKSTIVLTLILSFSTVTLKAQSVIGVSVTQCGADPTGVNDSAPAFARCLDSLPAGDLIVPAGTYKLSEQITKTRNQNLIGAGSKASILLCQSTTTPCVVVADTVYGPNDYNNSKIQDITIQGPGTGNASVGVFLGGDPAGKISPSTAFADSASLVDVRIEGFNYGVEWGNNAWNNKIVRSLIFSNSNGIYVPSGVSNSGENISVTDSNIFNNGSRGIDDHGNFEWMISGTSFDYNGTAVEFLGSTIHAINCHFEQNGGQVFFQPYGAANLSIKNSEILVQATTGSDPYILSTWPQSLNVSVDNVSIWSNHPVQYFMRVQESVGGTITNLYGNGNKMIGALSSAPSTATLTNLSAF
jgi:hypothetical protein